MNTNCPLRLGAEHRLGMDGADVGVRLRREEREGSFAAIQSDCIRRLDFHGPLAAAAGDTRDVALNFGQTSLPHLGPGRARARVFEYRFPIFGREGRIQSEGFSEWFVNGFNPVAALSKT